MQESAAFTPQFAASAITGILWLIPVAPMVASGVIALLKQPRRKLAASLAIGSLSISLLLSFVAFCHVVAGWAHGVVVREFVNFTWFRFGTTTVDLGWVLDPLAAIMMVMVSFVGLLIFIYSVGYMAHDENFTRFFCFLSLFAGAMLGVVISNSLLLLFMCWEIVGLTSYLLIGFWYQKPSAAAAAKKAFITTRVGDVFFLLGIVWLFSQTGTLLFYNHGVGSLEGLALVNLLSQHAGLGLSAAGAIGLLIFAGAVGKSGQLPLHVWLPDAMEGPTPVSALIHAATMVAAGVYLVARVYPLMQIGAAPGGTTAALTVVTWVGASTAVFAALIAVAQNDIKRILAYSTISQLGYMMAGLGLGGVAVGMFHLITHAFFKALLFLGAGSVIHGCHEEQDIRRMGGLKADMPLTFITYAIGMLALCGFPIFFSGFWSKDGILEAAQHWDISKGPFYLLVFGALLTAFYMTRQVCYVFFGHWRGHGTAHESPRVMTVPLAILAFFAIALGVIGTPAWPWFRAFLENRTASFELARIRRARPRPAHARVVVGRLPRSRPRLVALWRQIAEARSSRCAGKIRSLALDAVARSPLRRRTLWRDRDRVLCVVGARGRLARSPRLGRHRCCHRVALRTLGALQSLSRRRLGRWRIRQNLRGAFFRRRPAVARRRRPRAKLPAHSGRGRGRARRNSSLEQPAMNVHAFPILTLLTVLPLVGAAIALFSGRHARVVALFTTLACLLLALFIWTRIPADGSIGLVERAAWAPSLGIEYHLGVDGLGGLMLVLSAIVTLMAVDAAQIACTTCPAFSSAWCSRLRRDSSAPSPRSISSTGFCSGS